MGWIQEIADLLKKMSFFSIVYEYQQGLYFRKGKAVDKKVTLNREELEEIVKGEKQVIKDNRGRLRLMFPVVSRKKPNFPEAYRRSRITGLPMHKKRFGKVLEPGVYFNIPIIDYIVIDSQQEKVLNLGYICVLTIDNDSKVVMVSCNIRYQVMDLYRAYTAVYDYEASLKDYTLAILAQHSRGKEYSQWKDSKVIETLERIVKEDLRGIVTDKWGLKIHEVYITDNVASSFQRIAYEGSPLLPKPVDMLPRATD